MQRSLVSIERRDFFRAIDPRFRERALTGSRSAGRYSRAGEPTLYLSSSIDGVEAAMAAHRAGRAPDLEIVAVEVEAQVDSVFDLRDPVARDEAGVDLADAHAEWQSVVEAGGTPPSWLVRDRLVRLGAHGLIDPSRRRPGLWHLVLFRWNVPDGATVRIAPGPSS